ncbi:hypothetical protein pb186bvf_003443 [Paramecium bursaria]
MPELQVYPRFRTYDFLRKEHNQPLISKYIKYLFLYMQLLCQNYRYSPRSIMESCRFYHNFYLNSVRYHHEIEWIKYFNDRNHNLVGNLQPFILTMDLDFFRFIIDNSGPFQQYENMLKQQYIVGVYTKFHRAKKHPGGLPQMDANVKNNYTPQHVRNNKKINKNANKQILLIPQFLINGHFNQIITLVMHRKYALLKSKTSLYEQITQNNNCSLQCGDENNHLCIMNDEQCPISHFQINQQMLIIKERRQQTIIRIDNVQRNIQEPLIGMIVTNGNCSSLQNRSNYILKKEDQNCEFQQQMVPIMDSKNIEILGSSMIQINNHILSIGLRQYYVTPQCRFKKQYVFTLKYIRINSIYELQMNEITILCTLVVFIIFQIIKLIDFIFANKIRKLTEFNNQVLQAVLLFLFNFNFHTVCAKHCLLSSDKKQLLEFITRNSESCITLKSAQYSLQVFYQNQAIEQAQVHPETVDQDYSNSIQEQSSQNYQPQNNDETQNRTSLSMALNSIQARRFQSIEEQDSAVTKTDGDINSPIQSNKNQRQQLKKPRQNSKKIYRQVAPLDIIQFEQEENQFNRVRPLPD